jgi:transposase, IS5 family
MCTGGRCGRRWPARCRRAVGRALSGRMRGRLRRALSELAVTVERTATMVAQARSRLAGQMPDGATRLVSLHDPDARPIARAAPARPVEFGRKGPGALQRRRHRRGLQRGMRRRPGRPATGPRHQAGRPPHRARAPTVTADRGYGQAAVERDLHAAGVRTVAIPRQATTSAARKVPERSRGFRKLVKWRTGCEGRISYLKHRYGWDRTRLDSRTGAAIWCGHGVFAHNLVKIGILAS